MEYKNLRLSCLDQAYHLRTCGYWYTVQCDYSTPLKGFRTREALTAWLDMLNLSVAGDIPDKGEFAGFMIDGSYKHLSIMDVGLFNRLPGRQIYSLSNGDYTIGKLSIENGLVTITDLNPNAKRIVFDYFECQKQIDTGNYYCYIAR